MEEKKIVKKPKTEEELVKELQEGKSVKATDLARAMGIEVINF
jgi:hypothetical protein